MSKPSLTQLDRERKAVINASHFDPKNMGGGGPIFIYQSCSFVTKKYRDNYDKIKWSKE